MKNPLLKIMILIVSVLICSNIVLAQKVVRPRLLFGPEKIPAIRKRIDHEPYKTVFQKYMAMLKDPKDINGDVEIQLTSQAYIFTGKIEYAQRAKRILMNSRLKDWETRLLEENREEQPSALSTSRSAQNLCVVYDLIQSAGIFTASEEEYAEKIMALVATRLMERGKSFNPYDYYLDRFRVDNWNSDRFAAVGLFAMTFPNNPLSKQWLAHSVKEFNWHMENALLPDGTWPEGTRYQGAVLRGLIPFAYALKNQGVVDPFKNSGFRGMFESLTHLQTPRDKTLGGYVLMPGVGDSNWENIWEAVLAWGAGGFTDFDPEFAGTLMWYWQRAGQPFALEWSGGNVCIGPMLIDTNIKPIPQPPLNSELRPGSFAVFRNGYDIDNEGCMFFNVATQRGYWQHQHQDRGSFSLYAWNTPLAVDPGVSSYGDDLSKWYYRSKAHNMVLFKDSKLLSKRAWSMAMKPAKIVHHFFDNSLDYVDANLNETIGDKYNRRIFFIKPFFYLIWDDIKTSLNGQYQLHVLTENDNPPKQNSTGEPSLDKVMFECQNNINLEVAILSPRNVIAEGLVNVSEDMYPVRFYTEHDGVPSKVYEKTPKWLQVDQTSLGQDFVTVLYPRQDDIKPLRLVSYEQGRREKDREEISSTAIEIGSVTAQFYFGSQSNDGCNLKGKVGVILSNKKEASQTVYLIEGTEFSPRNDYFVSADISTSLVIRTLSHGKVYEIENYGLGFERVEIKLPWPVDVSKISVRSMEGKEMPFVKRDTTKGTISLRMNEKIYQIIADK